MLGNIRCFYQRGASLLRIFLADYEYLLVGKIHPGVVVYDAVEFALLIQVGACVVIVLKARAGQHEAIQLHFCVIAQQGGQNLPIAVQIAVYFGHRIAGVAACSDVPGVFAGYGAEFFLR